MVLCTPSCRKWTTFGVSACLIVFGIILVCMWSSIVKGIVQHELSLASPETIGFSMWKETPIPMYLAFRFFNWTNYEEVKNNWTIKPMFVELGPYTYHEHHIRENITFNDNNTVTFYNKRIWKYAPEKSVGSLDDKITTFNPIVAAVANLVKDKHYLVRVGVNFFLEEKKVPLVVTKTVKEFLFEGYDDEMLELLHKLHVKGINVPFQKFGWFVDRNNSAEYDGLFNMNNGRDTIDKLGLVRFWNYQNSVPYWKGQCGKVEGTTGELWYPPKDTKTIKIFSNDLCSSVALDHDGELTLHGIDGHKYVGGARTFDNGSQYPEMECFVPNGFQLSGVRNVSLCKYGAPAFISFPHFYQADPFYLESIEGLKPVKEKHEMFLCLEAMTGLPLIVRASFQLNLQMQQMDGIKMLENVQTRLMPAFWFEQSAELDEALASQVKILLLLPAAGNYSGYGIICIGLLTSLIACIVTFRKGWKESEEEQLLNQDQF
nr:protein croquemort-like [Leptinotarsa decemlineata]XP_023018231.1 protein croquemort-like [Leptinotarsa decemlineata]XP_023018232.1 protein croquemort-like [Leptinotarsa decemlineata]